MQEYTLEKGHRVRIVRSATPVAASVEVLEASTPIMIVRRDADGQRDAGHVREEEARKYEAVTELLLVNPWYAHGAAVIAFSVEDHPPGEVSPERRAQVLPLLRGTAGGGYL